MLDLMKLTAPGRHGAAILMLCAALPALSDTRFQVRRMTRDDVPLGKGQCDIRLQVDNEVEVSVRGDLVAIRTISGRDARDDGSECNAPLPDRDIVGFNFQVVDSRNEIRLLAEPSRRNGFAAIVRIRDSSGGEGRYHFRLSWAITGSDYGRPGGGNDRPPSPRDDNFDRTQGAAGFSWNNTVSFRGRGQGTASMNNSGEMRLGEVTIEIDRGGKLLASFRTEGRGRPPASQQHHPGSHRRPRPHAPELGPAVGMCSLGTTQKLLRGCRRGARTPACRVESHSTLERPGLCGAGTRAGAT